MSCYERSIDIDSFVVNVVNCQLLAKDDNGLSDPFCKFSRLSIAIAQAIFFVTINHNCAGVLTIIDSKGKEKQKQESKSIDKTVTRNCIFFVVF